MLQAPLLYLWTTKLKIWSWWKRTITLSFWPIRRSRLCHSNSHLKEKILIIKRLFILYDIRRQQRYLETRWANQKPAFAASERAFSLQLSSALSSSSHMVLDRCLRAQKVPDLNIFGKWGGWATFLCKEPFPPHQLVGAFDISSLPSPWKCCTCNHPSPWDCNQCNVLYANKLEFWNLLEASDLTLLKIFIFHSSIEGLAKRASTLFLKNGIMLCNISQTFFALIKTKPISSWGHFV